ncbi:T9SS type A sorting domain-containing protein [Portibacter marinus]|uniref:T9SS type A sorting domain-containing protein n=1 Tax=Portibacter marinus TaxID=2898660 RepID=UPI001F41E6B5|nr:T9SS type A sorting domain-containing protein [Portibacter marinus]
MDYLNTLKLKHIVLCFILFVSFNTFGQSYADCEDPQSVEDTECLSTLDLCIDYANIGPDDYVDIFVTLNDNIIVDPCGISVNNDAQYGTVEKITENGECYVRYTVTDPNYEIRDSFTYNYCYEALCDYPMNYCEGGGKIWTMQIQYTGEEDNVAAVVKGKEGPNSNPFDTIYGLSTGDIFFVDGTDLGKNQTEWLFTFYTNNTISAANVFSTAQVHTSCSEDIFGVDFGVFTPIKGCVASKNDKLQCIDFSNPDAVPGNFTIAPQVYCDQTYVVVLLDGVGLLPIDFGSVTGRAISSNNLITWSIDAVVGEEYLILQSSSNGVAWSDIMKTKNPQIGEFKFLDKNVDSEITYYRFKMISFNGDDTYSRSIKVANKQIKDKGVTVFPNPVKDVVNFKSEFKIQSVRILNVSGQVVHVQNIEAHQADINTQLLGIDAGIYYMEFNVENQERVIKKLSIF